MSGVVVGALALWVGPTTMPAALAYRPIVAGLFFRGGGVDSLLALARLEDDDLAKRYRLDETVKQGAITTEMSLRWIFGCLLSIVFLKLTGLINLLILVLFVVGGVCMWRRAYLLFRDRVWLRL